MSVNRVALVSPYALSVFGGVQEQVLAMSRVLSARGKDVLVVVPDAKDETAYDTPARVLRLGARLSLPANGSKAPLTLSPGASTRAKAAVRLFSPDVVHLHEPFAPLLGWATLRAHGFAQLERSSWWLGTRIDVDPSLLGYLADFLDAAVSVSESAAVTIKNACGLDSDVLFNGFEMERFVANPRERSNQTVLFYVGRLERRKGVATLVEAVREHNAKAPSPWHLVIAGDGADRGRLEAMAAHDEEILFLGRVSDDEKRRWLRRVNAWWHPRPTARVSVSCYWKGWRARRSSSRAISMDTVTRPARTRRSSRPVTRRRWSEPSKPRWRVRVSRVSTTLADTRNVGRWRR